MKATFFVVDRLAVLVLLGSAFVPKHVRAILPMDDRVILASDESFPFSWKPPRQATKISRRSMRRAPISFLRKKSSPGLLQVYKSRVIPPRERWAIWVHAPGKGTYSFLLRGFLLQSRGLPLANRAAEISPIRSFRVCVCKFLPHAVRRAKGIVIESLRRLTPAPAGHDNAGGAKVLLEDKQPLLSEGEDVQASSLLVGTIEDRLKDPSDSRDSENWEKLIAESLDELKNKSLRGEGLPMVSQHRAFSLVELFSLCVTSILLKDGHRFLRRGPHGHSRKFACRLLRGAVFCRGRMLCWCLPRCVSALVLRTRKIRPCLLN